MFGKDGNLYCDEKLYYTLYEWIINGSNLKSDNAIIIVLTKGLEKTHFLRTWAPMKRLIKESPHKITVLNMEMFDGCRKFIPPPPPQNVDNTLVRCGALAHRSTHINCAQQRALHFGQWVDDHRLGMLIK
jgi:hypothetical protein